MAEQDLMGRQIDRSRWSPAPGGEAPRSAVRYEDSLAATAVAGVTETAMADCPSDPASIERPPFLVGAERSGTTMLALMLDSHPGISWGGEMQYLVDCRPNGEWPSSEAYCEWLEADRGFRLSQLDVDRSLSHREIVRSFLQQKQARAGKPLVGATVHQHFDRLLDLWPDARFLHLVRDPRDVARSVIRMGWAGNTWVAAERWLEAETLWDRVQSRVSPERTIEIRFEALVANPPQVLADVCKFLGLEYDPAMLAYPEHTTYEIPDPSIAHTWTRKASDEDVQLAEAQVGALLESRGYERSDHPALEIGPADETRLRRQSRLAQVRYRIDEFGWPLFLAELVARRLGLEGLKRRLRLRQHDVVNRKLK